MSDRLYIGGVLAAAGQCQSVSALLPSVSYGESLCDPVTAGSLLDGRMESSGDECRGAIPFQLEISYHPNDRNDIVHQAGYRGGKWSPRSYGLPSYDTGAALEWEQGPWSLNGIGMNIAENDDGNNFNFWGVQAAYQADSTLGIGNYRIVLAGTSSAFLDPTGTKKERLLAGGLSLDQEFGEIVGGFLRFTWQREEAAVDYGSLYSGGINFNGSGWSRDDDNIGIGCAYLGGGNQGIKRSQVFEAYYRAALNGYVAVTADIQYMKEDVTKVDPRQDDPEGWIFGMRLTAEL